MKKNNTLGWIALLVLLSSTGHAQPQYCQSVKGSTNQVIFGSGTGIYKLTDVNPGFPLVINMKPYNVIVDSEQAVGQSVVTMGRLEDSETQTKHDGMIINKSFTLIWWPTSKSASNAELNVKVERYALSTKKDLIEAIFKLNCVPEL